MQPIVPSHSTPNFLDSAFFDNRWSSATGNSTTPSLPIGSREAWTVAGRSNPTTSSSSGDEQCFGPGTSNSSSCSPSLTVGSESPSDLGIVEFVPGKKWIEPRVSPILYYISFLN